jgi:hypothetical protein
MSRALAPLPELRRTNGGTPCAQCYAVSFLHVSAGSLVTRALKGRETINVASASDITIHPIADRYSPPIRYASEIRLCPLPCWAFRTFRHKKWSPGVKSERQRLAGQAVLRAEAAAGQRTVPGRGRRRAADSAGRRPPGEAGHRVEAATGWRRPPGGGGHRVEDDSPSRTGDWGGLRMRGGEVKRRSGMGEDRAGVTEEGGRVSYRR